jgi:uncharacterized zinc-type alcohol dehydrogenase-like protein
MIKAVGYAAKSAHDKLHPFQFERDEPKAGEVVIEVLYCGVCHSDVHQVKNEWKNTVYPCLPGHEIVGRVARIGAGAIKVQEGDIVGVGCMIDSCRTCEACQKGEENYCEGPNSWLATYNGPMVPAKQAPTGENMYGRDNTLGGYSNVIVVSEDFVLKIPDGLAHDAAAPILCAGVTTYSPMKHWGVKAGDKVGIVGLGGLGHMAVKIAKALGAEVTVFTTSKDKQDEALALGAAHVFLEDDKKAFTALKASFDFILSTVPEKHDLNPFVELLKRDKTVVAVGALEPMEPLNNMQIAFGRKATAGSLIGSIAETREVLEFCAQHGIAPDIELIDIKDVNDAYKRVEKGDVRFRFVINMASLAEDAAA